MDAEIVRINVRVLKNSLALLASQVYITLTALIVVAQLPRYLGEGDYGVYSEIYAFVGLFEVIGQLGLRVILTREVARHREQATHFLGQVLTLKFPLAILAFATVMIATLVRPTTPLERFLIAICITESLVRGYSNTINGVLRAFELMEYNLMITLVDRTLAVAAVLIAVHLRLSLAAVFAAFLVSGIGRLLAAASLCWWRAGPPKWGVDLALWKRFVLEGWPVGLSNAIARAYAGVGIILLGIAGGATGLLSGALRINHLTLMLGISVTGALFPVLSRAGHKSPEYLGRVARNGLSILLALAFPFAAFYAAFSKQFIPWFLGAEFAPAASALLVLAPALVLGFARTYFSSLLRANNQQWSDMLAMAVALGANIVCNLILIPHWDFLGVAWAQLASEVIYLIIVFPFAQRTLSLSALGQTLAPAAVGTMGCLAVWIALDPVIIWARLPLGVVLYFALWLLIAQSNTELWAFLHQLWTEIRQGIQALARQAR